MLCTRHAEAALTPMLWMTRRHCGVCNGVLEVPLMSDPDAFLHLISFACLGDLTAVAGAQGETALLKACNRQLAAQRTISETAILKVLCSDQQRSEGLMRILWEGGAKVETRPHERDAFAPD